ncbi:hypothetical protein H2200_000382 [Cladophialophora chaetospira]|uniref:Uncharacterized protein n=1 Tax=Cladophialophora chaetospira TaxID=386627 RepID=A0AA38XNA9_9EURO|nr:hypothetical protein H2200_000382 [Cladophialophora chaetospira]
MADASERTEQQWSDLCGRVKALIPKQVGEEAWYLVIAAALVGAPTPTLLASFYTHLTKIDAGFSSPERASYLSLRFRDVVLKAIPLIGMPRVLCVLSPLAKAEEQLQMRAKTSVLTEKWRPKNINVQEIHDRGAATASTIYGPTLLPQIFDSWGSHKEDMKFNELFVAYGLYLSDFEVMTPLETEAVVYSTISCLGLRGPGLWHLRGIGRLLGARDQGVRKVEDEPLRHIEIRVHQMREAVMAVVEFVGTSFVNSSNMKAWATTEEVGNELNGWGDD